MKDIFCHLYDAHYKSKMHQYLGSVIPFYWLIGVRTSLRIWDQDNPTRSFQKVNFPSAGSSTFYYIQSWTELNPQTKRVPFGCEENKTSRGKTLLLNY